jgi:hypothetical protein
MANIKRAVGKYEANRMRQIGWAVKVNATFDRVNIGELI